MLADCHTRLTNHRVPCVRVIIAATWHLKSLHHVSTQQHVTQSQAHLDIGVYWLSRVLSRHTQHCSRQYNLPGWYHRQYTSRLAVRPGACCYAIPPQHCGDVTIITTAAAACCSPWLLLFEPEEQCAVCLADVVLCCWCVGQDVCSGYRR